MFESLWRVFSNADLRRRVLFTLGVLSVYRIGIYVTLPGVDRKALRDSIAGDTDAGLLGIFNLFSGGALEKASIFALGVMPYVSASIILQLLSSVYRPLEELRKEGEAGQRKINQYTRYGTVVLALAQGWGTTVWLESQRAQELLSVVREPGWGFRLMTMLTLATGTVFVMWLGEQITERGIGNGTSLVIFTGIVADFPTAVGQLSQAFKSGQVQPLTLFVAAAIIIGTVAVIILFERGQRRIPIEYSRRIVGRKMYGGQRTHLPLKVNASGVIPPIFASTMLVLPNSLAGMSIPGMDDLRDVLLRGGWVYNSAFVLLTVFFCYFYTAVQFPPVDVADGLKKQGAFIPGVRPGKATAEFIEKVLMRVTAGGAIYVALVCIIPDFLRTTFRLALPFGGTSIMIVVGVAIDTVNQVESYLISENYEGARTTAL
ncbi:MAG: preprotein translocase subunit SecY [Deltaproteobacteria bacterium]|nr:preprotein translocase subunit SecY [Deltaproteobacteria bacterium]